MVNVVDLGELLRIFESSLSHTKWRLKIASKRRLETDILALCTRMRAVIMVDYGGKMPELRERLCGFLKQCQKESSMFEHLRVMVIEDMIYLIHVKGIAELVKSSLDSKVELNFVDIEQDPPKMITQAEQSSIGTQLMSIQKMFSLVFPGDATDTDFSHCHNTRTVKSPEFIDLSSFMQDTLVTVPTLNGWLLGYPVVYLFSKEHIENAMHNLSTKSLHLFKISVWRNATSSEGSREDELMSFSVPYELSVEGINESWAEAFLAQIKARWETCKHVWGSLEMDVSGCSPQAIAF